MTLAVLIKKIASFVCILKTANFMLMGDEHEKNLILYFAVKSVYICMGESFQDYS